MTTIDGRMSGPRGASGPGRGRRVFRALPQPAWPVVALAAFHVADAAMCVGPVPFVRRCLEDVRFPKEYWPVLAPLKAAAATGLLLGTRVPRLGLVTNAAVVAYFVLAAGAHVRAGDLGRVFWLNCLGMLALSTSALGTSFVRR